MTHENQIQLEDLSKVADLASQTHEPIAQFIWFVKKYLSPRKLSVSGDKKAAARDFKRLQTFETFKISTTIVLNSAPFLCSDLSVRDGILESRKELTKSKIHEMMLGGLVKQIGTETDDLEIEKLLLQKRAEERQLDRVVDALKNFGLCKVHSYEGCGAKKPLVTTPLLTSLIAASYGESSIIEDHIETNADLINSPFREFNHGS